MQACLTLLTQSIKDIRQKKEDLYITKHISKIDYTASCAQKVIYEKLLSQGLVLHPGESLRYVIKDTKAAVPWGRFATAHEQVDDDAYRDLLIRATANLFHPFGLTVERLDGLTRNETQRTLFECFLSWRESNLAMCAFERMQRQIAEFS